MENNIITANDLKIKGVSAIEKATESSSEAIITVRGKKQYVILSMETHNYLRECELESAISESRRDIANGNYMEESLEEHIKRITRD
jgi:hypothetical protein